MKRDYDEGISDAIIGEESKGSARLCGVCFEVPSLGEVPLHSCKARLLLVGRNIIFMIFCLIYTQ